MFFSFVSGIFLVRNVLYFNAIAADILNQCNILVAVVLIVLGACALTPMCFLFGMTVVDNIIDFKRFMLEPPFHKRNFYLGMYSLYLAMFSLYAVVILVPWISVINAGIWHVNFVFRTVFSVLEFLFATFRIGDLWAAMDKILGDLGPGTDAFLRLMCNIPITIK
jgi:hypothetical protein